MPGLVVAPPGPGTYRRGSTPVERPYPVGAVDSTTMNGARGPHPNIWPEGDCVSQLLCGHWA